MENVCIPHGAISSSDSNNFFETSPVRWPSEFPGLCWKLRFLQAGFSATELDSTVEIPSRGFDLFVCGESRTDSSLSFQLVQRVRAISPTRAIVFVADRGSEQLAVRAFRSGATDYISHGSQMEELMIAVKRVVTENSVRAENAVVPSIREILVVSR